MKSCSPKNVDNQEQAKNAKNPLKRKTNALNFDMLTQKKNEFAC